MSTINPHKNKDWQLHVTIDWRLKKGRDRYVYCIACKGKGTWTTEGGWGSYYDEINHHSCDKCNGRGNFPADDIDPKPPRQWELFNRLKLAFNTYWHEMEGDDPKLARLNAELEMFEEKENGRRSRRAKPRNESD